jgi:predicted component of type VI protein secretion system
MMDVSLVLEKGKSRLAVHKLTNPHTVIGRRQDCALRIPSSEVSRRHCLLKIERSEVTVEDLESVNGTFLNGQRIKAKERLRHGDRLQIGPARFIVELKAADKSPRAEKPKPKPVEAEVVEALPDEDAAEASFLEDDEEGLSALPLLDDEVEESPTALLNSSRAEPLYVEDDELVASEEETDAPKGDDFRTLLSQLDDRKPPRNKR